MKDTIRTFIAVKIVAEKQLGDLYLNLKKSLKSEEIRWVDINNLHLTLRFLGETTSEQVSETIKMLETVTGNFQPFQFEIKGTGIFKNKLQPRVLFLSVINAQILIQLAEEIRNKLKQIGFNDDDNTFNPHLTLGRIKYIENKDAFYALVKKYSDSKIQEVTVTEIIFYQSILGSAGPTYKPIKIIKLNNWK